MSDYDFDDYAFEHMDHDPLEFPREIMREQHDVTQRISNAGIEANTRYAEGLRFCKRMRDCVEVEPRRSIKRYYFIVCCDTFNDITAKMGMRQQAHNFNEISVSTRDDIIDEYLKIDHLCDKFHYCETKIWPRTVFHMMEMAYNHMSNKIEEIIERSRCPEFSLLKRIVDLKDDNFYQDIEYDNNFHILSVEPYDPTRRGPRFHMDAYCGLPIPVLIERPECVWELPSQEDLRHDDEELNERFHNILSHPSQPSEGSLS